MDYTEGLGIHFCDEVACAEWDKEMEANVLREGGRPALDRLLAAPGQLWRTKPGWYWAWGPPGEDEPYQTEGAFPTFDAAVADFEADRRVKLSDQHIAYLRAMARSNNEVI